MNRYRSNHSHDVVTRNHVDGWACVWPDLIAEGCAPLLAEVLDHSPAHHTAEGFATLPAEVVDHSPAHHTALTQLHRCPRPLACHHEETHYIPSGPSRVVRQQTRADDDFADT